MLSAEIRALRERQLIDKLAEEWRAIARGAPPWQVIEVDGAALIMDRREQARLGTLEGEWTACGPGLTLTV